MASVAIDDRDIGPLSEIMDRIVRMHNDRNDTFKLVSEEVVAVIHVQRTLRDKLNLLNHLHIEP